MPLLSLETSPLFLVILAPRLSSQRHSEEKHLAKQCVNVETQQEIKKLYANEAHFKASLIIKGTSEKVSQFMMLLKSIYNKNICFNTQKFTLKRYRNVKSLNNL